jgi:hypothetical protein
MIDIKDLRTQVLDGLAASGCFEAVVGHEPKAAPSRNGVTAAIWNARLTFVSSSGLAALSARVEFQVRIYTSLFTEPQDDIDPTVMNAADAYLQYVTADFDLAGRARYVDFLGSEGEGLRAESGHVTQDSKPFRVIDIFIPIVINDAYPLSA